MPHLRERWRLRAVKGGAGRDRKEAGKVWGRRRAIDCWGKGIRKTAETVRGKRGWMLAWLLASRRGRGEGIGLSGITYIYLGRLYLQSFSPVGGYRGHLYRHPGLQIHDPLKKKTSFESAGRFRSLFGRT